MQVHSNATVIGPNVEFMDKGADKPKNRTQKSVWLKDFVQIGP